MNKVTRGLAGILLAGASVFGLAGKSDGGTITFSPDFSGVNGNGSCSVQHDDYYGLSSPGFDYLDVRWSDAPSLPQNTKSLRAGVVDWDFLKNSYVPRENVDPLDVSLYIVHNLGDSPLIQGSGHVKVSVDNSDGSYDGRPLFFQQTNLLGALVGSPIDFYSLPVNNDNSRTLPFDYSFDGNISTGYLVGGVHGQFTPEPTTLGLLALGGIGLLARRRRLGMGRTISAEEYNSARRDAENAITGMRER